ncbi:hypothetical protein [Pseudoalteromonas marina]|uniref:hypothetical protein n=1 Tax=Pseudoalteromonas marina TaxID=267375 RepID=UPI0023F3F32E|nr:hypothetical protein [Pseudoalteromonas marina]
MLGNCKLCDQYKELQKSHAIGNAVFKKVFRTLSGKGIALANGNNPIMYSSDSWAEFQLCKYCEQFLNQEFEAYSLALLRGQKGFIKHPEGVSFPEAKQSVLIKYFLSIYFRAALSGQSSYKSIGITKEDINLLKSVFRDEKRIPSSIYHVQISRVIDMSEEQGFSDEAIKQIICAPFVRLNTVKLGSISVCFMFEGFFIEIFVTGMKIKKRKSKGVLNSKRSILFVPYVNLFQLDEIVELMVSNLDKYEKGNHSINE